VSRVSGTQLRGFCTRVNTSRLRRWRVVGNVWEIWSARGFEPYFSRTRSGRLISCTIWPVSATFN